MKTPIVIFFLAVMLSLLGACSSGVNSVQRSNPQADPNYVEDQRIDRDAGLARALAVVGVNESRVSGNLLKIQVSIENLKGSARSFNYKFDWIGKDGMVLSAGAGPWKSITLKGRERSEISAVAASPQAVDFRLKLQEF